MKIAIFKVFALGEFSPWGRQFLGTLHSEEVIEITYEPNVQRFCSAELDMMEPVVIFLENLPENRGAIKMIRGSGKKAFLILVGRNFSKEDLAYAITQKVHTVFENASPHDAAVLQQLKRLEHTRYSSVEFHQLVRSMKSLLLQSEGDEAGRPLVHELKLVLSKMEKQGTVNELQEGDYHQAASQGTTLPFLRGQGLEDAMVTVNDFERTGVLKVKGQRPEEDCRVFFLTGKVVSATCGLVTGLKAIYRAFLWDNPKFQFARMDPQDCVVDQNLDVDIKAICEEGRALKRRFDVIRKEIPPPNLKLQLEPSALHLSTSLERGEFHTLASVVDYSQVAEVLDYNPQPDVHIYDALINLRKAKFIKVAA